MHAAAFDLIGSCLLEILLVCPSCRTSRHPFPMWKSPTPSQHVYSFQHGSSRWLPNFVLVDISWQVIHFDFHQNLFNSVVWASPPITSKVCLFGTVLSLKPFNMSTTSLTNCLWSSEVRMIVFFPFVIDCG